MKTTHAHAFQTLCRAGTCGLPFSHERRHPVQGAAGERPLPGPGSRFTWSWAAARADFLARLASRNPDVNYIGVDITDKVLILAKRNIERIYAEQGLPIDNVKTLAHDIERIPTLLDKADRVERIYINFCNPWNKKANHKKHRLTHTRQLLLYRPFLADGAEIWFKCDDDDLFKDTLRYMAEAGFEVTWQTRDLHADEPSWNIRTEHEQMFTEMGIPTKALIARKTSLPENAPAPCIPHDIME